MARLPVLFVSHGAPTVALEDDAYTRALTAFGARWKPRAVVALSAHWETRDGILASTAPRPETIHDFGGFPDELYRMRYPCPGDPSLAARAAKLLEAVKVPVGTDPGRGLDHGAWVPLRLIYPGADVPCLQISLPHRAPMDVFAAMGRALAPLRDEGVLLVGSGGTVHNLRAVRFSEAPVAPEPWAVDFEAYVDAAARARDLPALVDYRRRAPSGPMAAPTEEHYAPVVFAVAAAAAQDRFEELHREIRYGNLSMQTFAYAPGKDP